MAMVGHQTESIYRRYAVVDESMHREAAAKLDSWHAEQDRAQETETGLARDLAKEKCRGWESNPHDPFGIFGF
jgi:hypothetical protein